MYHVCFPKGLWRDDLFYKYSTPHKLFHSMFWLSLNLEITGKTDLQR